MDTPHAESTTTAGTPAGVVAKGTAALAGLAGAAAAGISAVQHARNRHGSGSSTAPEDLQRWRVVSVNLSPDDVRERLAGTPLGAWTAVETELRPAPGGRGTELRARLRPGDPPDAAETTGAPDGLDGETPVQHLRSALRQSKQLIETGEILRADHPGTSRPTALNAPLRAATKASGGVGRL